MGICESKSKPKPIIIDPPPIIINPSPIIINPSPIEAATMDLINKLKKSVCKIIVTINEKKTMGTGFFLYLSQNDKTQRYLLTNYHVIKNSNGIIKLEIYGKNGDMNNFKYNINLNNYFVKNFEQEQIDVSLIKINDNDLLILDNVVFLNYDNNYQKGYEKYKNKDIFSLGYPYGEEKNKKLAYGKGKIVEILEPVEEPIGKSSKALYSKASYIEFVHNIETVGGCSGSPIVLLDGTEIKVVGIHKRFEISNEIKKHVGTFIGYIVGKMMNKKKLEGNFILGEIDVNKPGEDIQIINSDLALFKLFGVKEKGNEDQIEKCQIMIDGKNIPFSYTYKFNKEGKHTIIYSFKEKITSISHLFFNCSKITYLDFSHFNSKGISEMNYIFQNCESLSNINLVNLNTEDVTDMTDMFNSCKSLTKLDLSGFNTKKVTKMTAMFFACITLKSINLQSFNTENVTDMDSMFYACESLKELNLSNFNTKNVMDMSGLFFGCKTLKRLDLSSFHTEKVEDMGFMFSFCESLNYLDLTNFNARSVKYMGLNNLRQPAKNMVKMFGFCPQLKRQNVKVKDKKILEALDLIGEMDPMEILLMATNPYS